MTAAADWTRIAMNNKSVILLYLDLRETAHLRFWGFLSTEQEKVYSCNIFQETTDALYFSCFSDEFAFISAIFLRNIATVVL